MILALRCWLQAVFSAAYHKVLVGVEQKSMLKLKSSSIPTFTIAVCSSEEQIERV